MFASETTLALVAIALGVGAFGLLAYGAYLIIRDTRRQSGRWGINLNPTCCPQCGTPAPVPRLPASLSQAVWGGWSCPQCGAELDKWGRALSSKSGVQKGQP